MQKLFCGTKIWKPVLLRIKCWTTEKSLTSTMLDCMACNVKRDEMDGDTYTASHRVLGVQNKFCFCSRCGAQILQAGEIAF